MGFKEKGETAEGLRDQGYRALELWDGGFTLKEVKQAGYSESELQKIEIGGVFKEDADVMEGMNAWFG